MFHYRNYGLNFQSEFDLPSLPRASGNPDVVVRSGCVPPGVPSVGISEQLGFNGTVGMFLIRGGNEIIIDPIPGADELEIRRLLLGRFMAFLLRQRGWLTLHASGIMSRDGGGLLFLGASGSGKSTFAAFLHASGYEVIADDLAAVQFDHEGKLVMLRGQARTRLAEPSPLVLQALTRHPEREFDGDKYTFGLATGPSDTLVDVKKLYLLDYGDAAGVEQLSHSVASLVLMENSFSKLKRMDRPALELLLQDCSRTSSTIGIQRLLRQKSLAALDEVAGVIEQDLVQ